MTTRLFICYVNVVLVSLCGRFVAVLVCGRSGLWPFWMYAGHFAQSTRAPNAQTDTQAT